MRITYIQDRPELCGGVKVAFQHADLLRRQGHEVTMLGRGRRPLWSGLRGTYVDHRSRLPRLKSQDLLIATFWTTVPIAEALGVGPVIHFCQGYEGDAPHLAASRPRIEEVYRRPHPAFVVSPHLAHLLGQRFSKESFVVPPPLDPRFRPSCWRRPGRRPWIAIYGIFEAAVKDVTTALEAVVRLRDAGQPCRVLRLSTLPLSAAERRILVPDRYLCRVWPATVARNLRRCGLLLFPSLEDEGFGLPLLEAMASKVPAVASAIPSVRFMSGEGVTLVTPRDSAAFAAAARELLADPARSEQAAEAAFQDAQRFRPESVAQILQQAVEWARDRTRRDAA